MDSAYNLLVDIGNTFIKWGRYRVPPANGAGESLIEGGHALHGETPSLAALLRRHPAPKRILISNVAGTRMRGMILRVFEIWPDAPQPYWLVSQAEQCGVRNGYRNPAQLGNDRWAALIGSRTVLGEVPTLVVNCGTATTLDLLTADGFFAGGAIMPGVGLMIRALHQNTAALPDADGVYEENPRQTVDAIVTGCQHAQAGAVERMFALHRRTHPDLQCLISGGAAKALASRLTIPFRLHENIVLEGLHRISRELENAAA